MKLILPNKKYENSYYALVDSAIKNGDYLELGNAYHKDEPFNDMLKRLKNRRIGKNISPLDVEATVFWIVVDNKIIGTIDLRHKLNKNYFERLGNIAYYIKYEERNKGYATAALKLALKFYKKLELRKVLITCYQDNLASSKVIIKNGGVLEKTFLDEKSGKYIERYWIELK